MAGDSQHQNLTFSPNQISHHYGKNVHILSSPLMLSMLSKLGNEATVQPQINEITKHLYNYLFDQAADVILPRKKVSVQTRMNFPYVGEIFNDEQRCVSVALARAGILPSHLCYEKLNYLIRPELVRQDHFYISRSTDESGVVNGVSVAGSKIGGSVTDSIVFIPDPMGATGSTIVEVYRHYLTEKPKQMVALHLIVTPEYLKKVSTECPELKVFALRLDRGLSSPDILALEPGKKWDQEIGLNNQQYIIPGAGGLGEVLNNSYC